VSDDLSDVPGIRVGHWTDPVGLTGCTVVLPPPDGAIASVDVRGAAPGTRETDLLGPGRLVERVHAVLLTGGSAYGLAAADGVMGWLEERGTGFSTAGVVVPIVPAAVLFDLGVGDARARPDASAGRAACADAAAGAPCGHGRFGAGTGATVGKLLGPEHAVPGGLGTASARLPGGGTVGAVVAVNAMGVVVDDTGQVVAGPEGVLALVDEWSAPEPGTQTTLAVVATDVELTKAAAHRLATVAHDGFARAVRPVHTLYDGDTVFALSVGALAEDPLVLEATAVEVVARAIRRAVT
jgi:L-aminopeptidase/D-esterase-like protein